MRIPPGHAPVAPMAKSSTRSYSGRVRIAALFLFDLLSRPRTVASELMSLRRRLQRASREVECCSPEERELAVEMRKMRARIAGATQRPVCCASCARKRPLPHGRWDGGYCCGTDTWRVFTNDELLALAASGTRPGDWSVPSSDAAGCLFRGPHGCLLRAEDRPNICLRYLCLDLAAELRAEGTFKPLNTDCESLTASFRRFTELRAARKAIEEAGRMERAFGLGIDD